MHRKFPDHLYVRVSAVRRKATALLGELVENPLVPRLERKARLVRIVFT
jgi:hypothetical protein